MGWRVERVAFYLGPCRIVVRLEIDRKDLAGLRASRGHPKYTEGARASRASIAAKSLYGWNSVNAVVSGRPMMFAICAGTYKQEGRPEVMWWREWRGQCVGWREWREGFVLW